MTRQFGLPAPARRIGEVVSALAAAGLFRLRGVLVGTVAYQTYPAILGEKLPGALLLTQDVDVAQFASVSAAVDDRMPPIRDVLLEVDASFREVPDLSSRKGATRYRAKGGLLVDVLTPNEGPDTDDPQHLPALQAEAQPLVFLDFLIHDCVRAVLLHGTRAGASRRPARRLERSLPEGTEVEEIAAGGHAESGSFDTGSPPQDSPAAEDDSGSGPDFLRSSPAL